MELFLLRNLHKIDADFHSENGSIKMLFDGAIIVALLLSLYMTYLFIFNRGKYNNWKEAI